MRKVRVSANYKKSHQRRSIKKDVLENFAKFPGNFNACAGLKPKNLLKKRFCHMCFPVKFRRTPFYEAPPNDCFFFLFFFFSIWVLFHGHSRITGQQGKKEGISLTRHYHFHPLHRHLDISRAITADSSPLHIGSSRTRTGKLLFPSASR